MEKPLLLHCCCAPCAGGCADRLLAGGREIKLYYSNSNIAMQAEFDRRLDSVKKLADIFHLELIVDPYDHAAWLRHITGFESEPEHGKRCPLCFGFSLARAAEQARVLDMNFATSLTVSPYKSSKMVFEAGMVHPRFECLDFKKKDGFLHSRRIALKYGFYLQNFCGCEFSRRPTAGKTE